MIWYQSSFVNFLYSFILIILRYSHLFAISNRCSDVKSLIESSILMLNCFLTSITHCYASLLTSLSIGRFFARSFGHCRFLNSGVEIDILLIRFLHSVAQPIIYRVYPVIFFLFISIGYSILLSITYLGSINQSFFFAAHQLSSSHCSHWKLLSA